MKITTKSKITYVEDSSSSDSSSPAAKANFRTVGGKIHLAEKKSTKLKQKNSQRDEEKGLDSTEDSGTSGDEDKTTSLVKETRNLTVKKKMQGRKADFTRVDRVYNKDQYRFILQESSEKSETDKFRKYALIVRRDFDYDHKHQETCLDIVSKPLKASLERIMGGVKGVCLEGDSPSLNADTAFLFQDDLRTEVKRLEHQSKSERTGQEPQQTAREAKDLQVLVSYLDTDYDETKKTLYPLLESRTITFDLLWALFKGNEIMYAPTYGVKEEPWVFRLEYAQKDISPETMGEYYTVEGCYLECDGTVFGMGKVSFTIQKFKGQRKISSLACFPLKYHPDYTKLKPELIQRGKKFVALKGRNHRLLNGRAFQKTKLRAKRFNISGRVMIDSATFRRFNPGYGVSALQTEGRNLGSDSQVQTSAESESSSSEDGEPETKDTGPRSRGGAHHGDIEELFDEDTSERKFTDEQYLIASPVVLGYSLSEKLWIEIAVSGIRDIEWDVDAFASLVLPINKKNHIKALVESHSRDSEQTFDIIRGKGQGLIMLLYGPPGTGKTLTAESVSELLEKPLYNVTMGELGGKEGDLEKNLAAIFDLASTWSAVLLIDEAEVFLGKRQPHDITRNVLVSIFLRKLEYYKGILMLTTNYATSIDEAAVSRINTGVNFENLDVRARKSVWRLFVGGARVTASPDAKVADITEDDYEKLSSHELNGREIKNAVRTARVVAQMKKQVLSMEHLLEALASAIEFADDMKGVGYKETRSLFA